jgi:hypothetical protein
VPEGTRASANLGAYFISIEDLLDWNVLDAFIEIRKSNAHNVLGHQRGYSHQLVPADLSFSRAYFNQKVVIARAALLHARGRVNGTIHTAP